MPDSSMRLCKALITALFVIFACDLFSQETNSNPIIYELDTLVLDTTVVNADTLTSVEKGSQIINSNLEVSDSIRTHHALIEFKAKLLHDLQSYVVLSRCTDDEFIGRYQGNELNATAFNPILEEIEYHIIYLTNRKGLHDNAYRNFNFLLDANYQNALTNFDTFIRQWESKVTNSCKSRRECGTNKDALLQLNTFILQCVNNLTKFLES